MKNRQTSQRGDARTNKPERYQIEYRDLSLDQWLDADHRVRIVWAYIQSLDLSSTYREIRAVAGSAGRNAVDPRILFALWLFATIEGVTSARRLAELSKRDIAYLWICGGVSVNHNLLSQFRVSAGDRLEQLMVESIGALVHQNLVTLDEVTQDGMVVRANAGSSSFRTADTLQQAVGQAQAHLDQLKAEPSDNQSHDRREAAQQRAAEDRLKRVSQAAAEAAKLQAQREASKSKAKSEVRASTTDPEARVMKMGDGGFRPAFNTQFATDVETKLIVGVDLVNQGSDSGLMKPMFDQLHENYQVYPQNYFVDGRFVKNEDITHMGEHQTKVYGPLYMEQKQLAQGQDPSAAKRGDSPAMAEFRARMGTAEAKQTYKKRSLAEFPNADCRNRNLYQFSVRSQVKAKAQLLWHVVTFNFLRLLDLNYLEKVMNEPATGG